MNIVMKNYINKNLIEVLQKSKYPYTFHSVIELPSFELIIDKLHQITINCMEFH